MFFNWIKEIHRLRKEINRLLRKWMSNISSLSYYWEKPLFLKLRSSKFKKLQKQPFRGVLLKRCSKQIYRRTPMPKCNFNEVALQLYWNCTSAWVFSCKFAAYFQNNFSQEHLWMAAPEIVTSRSSNSCRYYWIVKLLVVT